MKRKYVLLIGSILCISLQGCGRRDVSVRNENQDIQFLYDIEEIPQMDEAFVYSAEPYRADEGMLCDIFLQDDVESEVLDAMGRMYYTESEAMHFYLREQDAGMYGGFDYSLLPHAQNMGTKSYQDIVVDDTEHPDLVEQNIGDVARADFAKWTDLDFQSVDKTLSDIENIMNAALLPGMQVAEVYSLDAGTMNEHASIPSPSGEEKPQIAWTKEDEAYLIYYEQVVDGIPLMNHIWTEEVRSTATETPITITYSVEGIVSFHVGGMVDELQKLEKYPLLTPGEAETSMANAYQAVAQVSEIEVEEMGLKYVVLYQEEDEKLILVPAYVFCIAVNGTSEDFYTDEMVPVKNYEHYVVNAINGERMVNASYEKNTLDIN